MPSRPRRPVAKEPPQPAHAVLGYARVSTGHQVLDQQLDALAAAGVSGRVFLAGQSKGVFTFQIPATTTSVSGSFASTLTTSYTKKDYSSAAETVATKPLTFTAAVS